ncbi:MAG: hypothetical protein WCA82_14995 [Jiangellales bacterium]
MNGRVLALCAAVVLGLAGCAADEPDARPAALPTASATADSAGGTMLATAFSLTEVLRATDRTKPADVLITEIPMDTRWLSGNRIEVPIERDGAGGVLVVTVLPEQARCAAESPLLTPAESDLVATEVCAAWEAGGRLPVVVPDPDAPVELNPEDAAR